MKILMVSTVMIVMHLITASINELIPDHGFSIGWIGGVAAVLISVFTLKTYNYLFKK